MRIAVLNGFLPDYTDLALYTIKINKAQYCKRHGYHLETITSIRKHFQDPQSHAKGFSWSRLEHMADMVESGKWDWIWCVGADTLVTNMTISMDDLVNGTSNDVLICGERVAPIQADSFLVRSSPGGSRWLRAILATYPEYKHHIWVENQAMIDTRNQFKDLIQIIPQYRLNSYDYRRFYHIGPQYRDGTDCYGNRGQWMPGDFLIHWPAATLEERLLFLAEYIDMIQY